MSFMLNKVIKRFGKPTEISFDNGLFSFDEKNKWNIEG